MLVSSLYNYVRNLARGARVDLDGLERSGAVFRGGAAPLQWVVGSAQAFEAPAPPPSRAPPLPTGGFPHFPPGALRRLSEDLRAWLLRRPWPHEAVLSRSGVAPFLGTLAGTRAYPCAPSTSHVRAAVASHGVDAHLAWESHTVWIPNLQPDFNVRVCERFDASSSAVLGELDESNRFVQKSAESTSI